MAALFFCEFLLIILMVHGVYLKKLTLTYGYAMSIKQIIENFYDIESIPDFYKDRLPITFRLTERSLQMLQALADRFKQSRSGFGGDLLESAIFEAFESLSEDDKKSLASKSDEALKIAGFPPYWVFQVDNYKPGTDVEKDRLLAASLGLPEGTVFLGPDKFEGGMGPEEQAA